MACDSPCAVFHLSCQVTDIVVKGSLTPNTDYDLRIEDRHGNVKYLPEVTTNPQGEFTLTEAMLEGLVDRGFQFELTAEVSATGVPAPFGFTIDGQPVAYYCILIKFDNDGGSIVE